ncbi:hypothetical protein GCM10023189_44060 [Nibrella saemangeumensis]|uniref:Sugar 3,4-ketoisomerase QdtA cupin domain-containing protein n=1 Tax=Nibrella saemangeumensis TaxID=1084526 RepID=A0ABP8NFN0_9BACT
MISSEPHLIPFRLIADATGTLISTQDENGLPFAVKRVFWVFAAEPGTERGGHAHRTTQELLVVLQGRVRVETETRQGERTFQLAAPNHGLFIPPLCWITVHPSSDAILCCLTSNVFDEADYIRNYSEFRELS